MPFVRQLSSVGPSENSQRWIGELWSEHETIFGDYYVAAED